MKRQKSSLGNHKVCQTEQRKELCRVLGESYEPDLFQTKDILDVVERMLTYSSGTGFGFLNGFKQCIDRVSLVKGGRTVA